MTMPRFTVPRVAHCAGGELDPGPGTQAHYAWLPARPGPGTNHGRWPMFGIAAIVAFAIALILQLASVSRGVLLTPWTFALIGLLCLAIHHVLAWWPQRHA